MKLNKKIVVGVVLVCVVLGILIFKRLDIKDKVYFLSNNKKETKLVEAEQSGSSPESGATSKLKSAYDGLVSKGTNYGDSQPADWPFPSYGTYWDRILYAAAWEPDPTTTASQYDVLEGKTFYAGDNGRTLRAGTLPDFIPDYSEQSLVDFDDGEAGDVVSEESLWVKTNSASGQEVWYDTRTRLYWARSQTSNLINSYTAATCDFFTTSPRGDYTGSDAQCSNAINACANLSLPSVEGGPSDTDWYLPTQKELLQASINGIYNQTSTSFTTTGSFWSSTPAYNNGAVKYYVTLVSGYSNNNTGDSSYPVRCIRRD